MTGIPIPPPALSISVNPSVILVRRALRHRSFMLGFIVIAFVVAVAIFAPLLAPHDPYKQNLLARMTRPALLGGTWNHVLGTDTLGRDYLSRLIYGARVSLMIGGIAAAISCMIGTTLGILGGYFGGRVDTVVMFFVSVRLALPATLVALAVVALFGGSLTVVIVALGCLLWDRFAVVMRSATMQVRKMDYIAAAEVLGASVPRVLWKDVLPNVMNSLIVVLTLEMAHAIILESALSFLGLGVQPPTPSWGLMISEGKEMLLFESWLITIPGVALFVLLLAINMLGDGIRDISAPEGRN
jgi:peptide/nickel transport system permease protein